MSTCLVTGATGFIGSSFCKFLKKNNHKVIGVSKTKVNDVCDEHLFFDFFSENIPIDKLKGVETVYHLAGIAHSNSKKEEYKIVNVNFTINLFKNSIKAGVKSFVFVSSVKAVADCDTCTDEDYLASPLDYYGKSKKIAEEELLKIAKESDISLVIARPSLVYGKEVKGNLAKLITFAKYSPFSLPKINNRRSMVGVDDLCEALYFLNNHKLSKNKVFIITDGIVYSTTDIYHYILKKLGKNKPLIEIPFFIFKIIAFLGDRISMLPLKSVHMVKIFGSNEYSAKKLQSLGWCAKKTLHDYS